MNDRTIRESLKAAFPRKDVRKREDQTWGYVWEVRTKATASRKAGPWKRVYDPERVALSANRPGGKGACA